MREYSSLPFDKVVTFTVAGKTGLWDIDLVRGEDGLGIPAKSLYIGNIGQLGTITVELSPDGYNPGRTIVLGPGASRNYEIADRIRVWSVKAYCSVIGGTFAIGATPGEWTEEEWLAYCTKVGAAT